ncbi:MAG: glycosyltransferase family 4 protein [Candidatus Omnitrophota bacterium]
MTGNTPQKIRVHLVTDEFSLGGGIEHIYQLTRGLGDFHFKVFGEPGLGVAKFKNLGNVDIHDRGYHPSSVLKGNPDLIHIHHLKPLASFFKNPLKKYPVPIIYTAHGLHIHKYEFHHTVAASLKYFLRFQLEKRILPKTDRVIAVSLEDKDFLETYYRLNQVTYLTNGIDSTRLINRKIDEPWEDLRKRLGLPMECFIFVTVARFDFQKGYDILIKAISKIRHELDKSPKRCLFVWVGDGETVEDMKRLSHRLSVSSYIRFVGARTDGFDFIRAGDVCILPSRWEGLPIVLLETGLLKIPVIASDTYGNREIIKKDMGILFKNQDEEELGRVILDVLLNRGDRDNMARWVENLYQEVELNYNLGKMLSGLRDIYRSYHFK